MWRKVCFVFMFLVANVSVFVGSVYIKSNGYKGVSVSFSRSVKQEDFNFEKLKEVLRKSSEFLYYSTRRRSYFSEFILTLPATWKNDLCENSVSESPRAVDIYITNSDNEQLQTQHSEGCSKKGELIYMPLSWFRGNTNDLARQFIQQWSTFRYGVFEETPLSQGSCFLHDAMSRSPTGCYNVDLKEKIPENPENGIDVCDIRDDFYSRDDLKSSMMFASNTTKMLNFCDGSGDFPHNPVMATRHNSLCNGKPTWAIVADSEDFKFGRNPPLQGFPATEAIFKCFQEPSTHLTLAIQNSSTEDISTIVEDIRYSLLRFLHYDIPGDSKVQLVTFSDDSYGEMGAPHGIDFENLLSLQSSLKAVVRTVGIVKQVCLSCGLQKALNASRQTPHPSPIILLIALESSVKLERPSDVLQEISNFESERLHLVFIQDTPYDVIPSEIVAAVQRTGGQVFSLNSRTVFMRNKLNVILVDAVESPLHLEERTVVVHEATFENITSGITEVFSTESGLIGRMVYTLQCNDSSLQPLNPSCTTLGIGDKAYTCGAVDDLRPQPEDGPKIWTHAYQYLGGIYPITCATLATVQLLENSSYPVTLRGWLNHYTIKPGQDSLVIYAEVITLLDTRFRVHAKIYGPGTESDLPEKIELFDNGSGDPDVKNGDHIFSRYFTRFRRKGTYLVTLSAESETQNSVSRSAIVGSFSVVEEPPEVDIYPPNRVGDLKVVAINHENGTLTLSWTAPGNDYDYGSATKYDIKYSMHWPELLLDIAFDNPDVRSLVNIEENEASPASGTMTEKKSFHLPPKREDDTVYFIALRAHDTTNKSPISNVVQAYIRSSSSNTNSPIVLTETEMFSTSISSTGTENDENDTTIATQTAAENETMNYTVTVENYTTSPTDSSIPENCLDKNLVILIAASAGSGFIVILIVVNVLICLCCFKKRNPKQLSRKTSLRPPYNLNIAYRKDESEIEMNREDRDVSSSLEHNIYTDPQSSVTEHGIATNNYEDGNMIARPDLKKLSSPRIEKNDFQVVKAMPAYATTSLSSYQNESTDTLQFKPRVAQPQQAALVKNMNSSDEAQVYSLGLV